VLAVLAIVALAVLCGVCVFAIDQDPSWLAPHPGRSVAADHVQLGDRPAPRTARNQGNTAVCDMLGDSPAQAMARYRHLARTSVLTGRASAVPSSACSRKAR